MRNAVMVVGAGRMGTHLAGLLSGQGHHVVVLDDRPAALDRVRAEVPSAHVAWGAGSDPAALESAGIRTVDVIAAATALDEVNVLACCLAREEFGVPRTIARIVDPAMAWMYTAKMGVDVALDQADLMATMVVEEMSLGDMVTLLKLSRGRFSIVEERVHARSSARGTALGDMQLPDHAVLLTILRGSEVMLATPDLVLQADDEVIALARSTALPELQALLGATRT